MDWKDALVNHIDKWRQKKFNWATGHCIYFVADWIKTCTGEDPIKKWRGKTKSKSKGYKLLSEITGKEDAEEAFLTFMLKVLEQYEEVPLSMVQSGDVLLTDNYKGELCCTIWNAGRPWGVGPNGALPGEINGAQRAFRIPKGVN